MTLSDRRTGINDHRGQTAVEYLLALSAVFLALVGVAALFGRQIQGYWGALLGAIGFPL